MTIAHVQSGAHGTTTGATTVAVTLGAAVTSGNLLAGYVFWPTATLTDLTSITDDKSNTYTIVDKVTASGVGWNRCFAQFYLANITNAPTTITANFGSAVGLGIFVDEYSGIATSTPLDGHAMNVQGTSNTVTDSITSGNITTTVNGDLIYGSSVDLQDSSGGQFAGTGFTLRITRDNTIGLYVSTEDEIQSSAGAVAATFTFQVASAATITGVMAFSPPGGGGDTLMGAICL